MLAGEVVVGVADHLEARVLLIRSAAVRQRFAVQDLQGTLIVPDFNDADHPVDDRTVEFSTEEWGTVATAVIPRDFTQYVYTTSIGDYPKIDYKVELMDADTGVRGGDDRIGESKSFSYTILQLAKGTESTTQAINSGTPSLTRIVELHDGGSGMDPVEIDLQIGATINPCAVRWATLYNSDTPMVDLPAMGGQAC